MLKQLSIVIPAFNEAPIIGKVLTELHDLMVQHGIEAEIVVVDDGSSDGTAQEALSAGARVIRHRSNRGYGASLKTGILAATYDTVAITDADGTYPAKYLPEMLRELDEHDMVVGSRTGAKVHIPLVRKPAKWVLNRLANYVSGHKIPDLNSGMRVFRREIALQYFGILPDQFSFTTTITMAMLCDKYAIKYVPIDYRKRTGKSKIVPWDAASFTILILRMAVLFRPLRVFLPIVLLCLVYGVTKAGLDLTVFHDRNISATAVLAMMTAIMLLSVAMIAEALVTRLGRLSSNVVSVAREKQTVELVRHEASHSPETHKAVETETV
jgi:glycosyltransferase involved in cell wall biosynthesis